MSYKVILFAALIAFSCSQFLSDETEETSEVLLGASNGAASTIVSCVKSKRSSRQLLLLWENTKECAVNLISDSGEGFRITFKFCLVAIDDNEPFRIGSYPFLIEFV